MASNRSYTLIGLFMLGAIVLLVAALLAFGGTRLLSDNRTAVIFFDQSVLGLSNGSKVLFRGVQIGTVKQVQLRLDPDAGKARIGVTVEMNGNNTVMMNGDPTGEAASIESLVQQGLRAQLVVWSYVTSQLAVNLDFQPDSEPNLIANPEELEYPEIPAVPSEIEQLKDTVSDLPWRDTLTTVNDTMQSMVRLADDMDTLITELGPSLTQTSDSARETMDAARSVIQSSDVQVSKTLAELRKLTQNVNQQITSRDGQIDDLLSNAQRTSRNLQDISENLEVLTDPGSNERQDINSAIRDLSVGAASLRRFAETLERDPNAILFGGSR